MPEYADPREVSRAAKQWGDDVLACRTLGHNWTDYTAAHYARRHYFYVILICQRCGSKRHEEMDEYGEVISRWMEYAEGYLSEGLGRIVGRGRNVIRLAARARSGVRKITKKADERAPRSQAMLIRLDGEEAQDDG